MARERSFRRAVRRHASCFYGLSRFQRRVLTLRAGLRGARAHSRASAARRLGVSEPFLRRAEHRGLEQLRRTDRSHGCGVASARVAEGLDSALSTLAQALGFAQDRVAGVAELAASGGQGLDDRGEVAGARTSSGGVPRLGSAGVVPLPEADSTADEDPLPLIAAVLACALLMATAAAARRRLRHAEAAEGPAGDRWSEAEGDIPPPPWSVPPAPWSTPQRAAEQAKPSPRGDGRALKPPGSARRHGHPERPGSSRPRKRD